MSDKRSFRFKNLPGMPGKVLAVTLLGLLGIVLIYLLVGKAFHQIGQNVEALARPNARLIEVNRLFRGVAQLGHLQQRDLLATPSGEGAAALAEARQVRANIDTLRVLFSGDSFSCSAWSGWRIYCSSEVRCMQSMFACKEGGMPIPTCVSFYVK